MFDAIVSVLSNLGKLKGVLDVLGHFLNIQSIAEQLKNIGKSLRRDKINIAIVGPGGVGKTILGCLLSLSGENDLKELTEYNQSRDLEREDFKSENYSCALIIAPGQKLYKGMGDWNKIYEAIENDQIQGLFNLVSYGYHAPYSTKGVDEYEKFEKILNNSTKPLNDKKIKKFLEHNREQEIKNIQSLMHKISRAKKLWMITLVTKEDLWWDKRLDVHKFYKQGEYNNYIEQIKTLMGSEKFVHEYESVCLVINNLVTGDEQKNLRNTSPGYTSNMREKSMQRLLKTIESCLDRFNKS